MESAFSPYCAHGYCRWQCLFDANSCDETRSLLKHYPFRAIDAVILIDLTVAVMCPVRVQPVHFAQLIHVHLLTKCIRIYIRLHLATGFRLSLYSRNSQSIRSVEISGIGIAVGCYSSEIGVPCGGLSPDAAWMPQGLPVCSPAPIQFGRTFPALASFLYIRLPLVALF